MLQNGIDLSTVDVSYVSSRSWYGLKFMISRYLYNFMNLSFSSYIVDWFPSNHSQKNVFRYFLNLFGLRGLFSLILGEDNGQYYYR